MAIFEKTTLGNGIRVVTAPFPQVGSVSCFVMLSAGSRYETPDAKGIAHFAEHMFFKGTERRPTARTISTEIDAIGGEFNAFTGKELTGYYVRCGSETRDTALDVLADMLLHSKFDAAEIEKEKGVILEEMNVYLDTPQRYVGNVYDRLLYADQPLGWDIIGTRETVEAATRETFLSYLDTWYRPERMVVGIGGRLGDGLTDRLEELLGGIEARPTGEAPQVELPPDASPVLLHTKDSEQAHLILGVRGYPIGHPNRYALQLLAVVLGGGMSSRLFTEVAITSPESTKKTITATPRSVIADVASRSSTARASCICDAFPIAAGPVVNWPARLRGEWLPPGPSGTSRPLHQMRQKRARGMRRHRHAGGVEDRLHVLQERDDVGVLGDVPVHVLPALDPPGLVLLAPERRDPVDQVLAVPDRMRAGSEHREARRGRRVADRVAPVVERGRRKLVGGQEDLIMDIALELKKGRAA